MKRSRLLPALGLFAGALFWGCFSDKSVDPTSSDTVEELQLKGSISGTVTDSVNHGISGVAVTLDSGGFATNTDSLGRYTIPDVPGRTWTVRFTKTNWKDTSLTGVVLAIDEDKKGLDMRMRPLVDSTLLQALDTAGSFGGKVVDTAGSPLSGVSVLLNGLGLNTTTDSLGAFLLPKVPAGIWGLSFTRPGYADTSSQKLAISRKEVKTGIIAMMRPIPVQIIDTTGSFAGTVVDTAGTPLSAVTVYLVNGSGQVAFSDSTGHFLLSKVPADTWDLSFTRSGYAPKTLTGLVLARKEAKTGLIAMMRRQLDTAIAASRQVFGLLTDPTGIVRLEAIVTTNSGTTTSLKDLTLGTNGAFAALLPLGSDSGSLKLIARDAAGHATGYITVPFVAGGTAIQVPSFTPTNAIPKLDAGKDTTVPVGRTILLKAQARDTLDNAGIASLVWSCGTSTSWTPEGANGFSLALPRDSGSLTCRVRAADKDSNVVKDSLVLHVVNTPATITSFVDVSVYTPTVNLSLQATDAEGVAKILWNFGDGKTDSTFTGNSSAIKHTYAGTFPTNTSFPVTVTVMDSMGGTTHDTMEVTIANPQAIITGLDNVTIYTNTVNLSLKATDANGVAKILWNFGDGTTDSTLTGTSSVVKHTYAGIFPANTSYPVTVTVMESMGGTTHDTINVTIANPQAIITGLDNVTIYTNTVNLSLKATDANGVAKILWNFGDGTTDSTFTGTNSTVMHTYAGSFPNGKIYTVKATAVDSLGGSTPGSLAVTITNPYATINLTFDTTTITPNDTASYTATISDKNGVAKVIWNFGDGTIDTTYSSGTVTQKHAYPGPAVVTSGTARMYSFSIEVLDSLGGNTSTLHTGWKKDTNDIPTVVVNDTVGEVGTSLTLHAVAKDLGKITQYEWSLDGTNFTLGAKDATIALPATPNVNYPIYVRVKDEDGNVSKVDTIRIIAGQYITDARDGQRYRITTIGSQTWMAQNLNYKVDSSWWYMNSADSGAKYGRLYTWASAMGLDDTCNTKSCATLVQAKHQGVCPSGWHVPADADWNELATFIKVAKSLDAPEVANFLRAEGQAIGWTYNFPKGGDPYGFTALPSGMAANGKVVNVLEDASMWSSTEKSEKVASYRYFGTFYFSPLDNSSTSNNKSGGYSLRCLKD